MIGSPANLSGEMIWCELDPRLSCGDHVTDIGAENITLNLVTPLFSYDPITIIIKHLFAPNALFISDQMYCGWTDILHK